MADTTLKRDTCATCGGSVVYVRLVGRGFWEHEHRTGTGGHVALALRSMSGGLLVEQRDLAESAVRRAQTGLRYGKRSTEKNDRAAYDAAVARRNRLEAERQRRVMIAMREDGPNG